MNPHIVCIDGHNFMHRARAGFALGDYHIVFNFFRNLRALVERLEPTRLYFVLEGHPQHRYDILPEYKANRKIDPESTDPAEIKRFNEMKDFHRQKDLIVELLSSSFPASVMRHPDYECDDVIYNLIRTASTAVPWTVVSNDSDFTQLLNEFEHVTVYNPMLKENVVKPEFDYVVWKSLRGDGSDNVPGIPGIGDARALELVNDPEALSQLFEDKNIADQFKMNHELISFKRWTVDGDALDLECSFPVYDHWATVKDRFESWGFKSLLKESTWTKFERTFEHLWGRGENP